MRAGQLRQGGKAAAMLGYLQSQGRACTVPEITAGTGETSSYVWARLFEMTKAGHVMKVAVEGQPVRFEAAARADVGPALAMPLRTITTAKGGDLALAEPVIVGYRIDILYRMLDPRELFAAQGFPRDYIIDRTADGRMLKVHESVRLVGNSVSPPPLRAIAQANLDPAEEPVRMAA